MALFVLSFETVTDGVTGGHAEPAGLSPGERYKVRCNDSQPDPLGRFAPRIADPLMILAATTDEWAREHFEIYLWPGLADVIIFDTADYRAQSRLFKRLAYFTEKEGFTGSVATHQSLWDLHGYNAHNYRPEDLARFFNTADTVSLNREESLLKQILLRNGIITCREAKYYPGAGGLISISQESVPSLRKLLFIHELFHGVYYTLPAYRRGVKEVWEELEPAERTYWILFLRSKGYDVEDEFLVTNEFQAYLLQQADRWLVPYFERKTEDFEYYPESFERALLRLKTLLRELEAMEPGVSYLKDRDLILRALQQPLASDESSESE
jgi:hypothetical protein